MDPFALPDPNPPALPEPLVLNRAAVDRAGLERAIPGTLDEALADPTTRVLLVDGARVAVQDVPGDLPLLAFASIDAVRGDGEAHYLGRDERGAYVAWSCDLDEAVGSAAPGVPQGARPASLRDVGGVLGARDVGLATEAVALSQWRRTHRRCPRCGAPTALVEAGWAARCAIDGHVVYPRTDPAVIMAVHDGAGRLLLARSVAWPARRRSVLAGFVEAGEAPEAAVRREVAEEVGVRIGHLAYAGAQPWPFPASLMLGYHAWVADPDAAVLHPDGAEITHADWFSRDDLAGALASGQVHLPMRTSIALALIESWFGAPLPGGA